MDSQESHRMACEASYWIRLLRDKGVTKRRLAGELERLRVRIAGKRGESAADRLIAEILRQIKKGGKG